MQLTAKDAVWRPGSAAEVARRAAELRDRLTRGRGPAGPVGLAGPRQGRPVVPAQAGPADPPITSGDHRLPPLAPLPQLAPPMRWPRTRCRPSARAASGVLMAGLVGISLAGVLKFTPALHQVSTPSFISGQPQGPPSSRSPGPHQASQPSGAQGSATGPPVADPAAVSLPTANEQPAAPGKPDRKPGHGHQGSKKHGHQKDGKPNPQVLSSYGD